jgi:hypothetical protein
VYVVRHPVERAYSHYGHHMRLGVHCTFEEALERRSIYVDCSRYDVQIDRWRESLSDPSQLLVVTTDELRQMDQGTLVRIQRHIGVEPCDIWSQGPVRSNERGARYLLSHRVAPFRRHPMVSPFVSAIPESARDWVRDLLLRSPIGARWKKATELAPMLPETRVRLLAEFEPATAAVERETGRTLEGWRR